ncbi:Chromosome partition protein Smc [Corynebacterium capitovis DSM 44611]|uniref:chromosome segregation protein SMC n=1 Tax=Corynebacterium capitovis TaxID=131081 RepID=UPI000380155D|nr:chromosome segregation protein SMC [Corynebacterium capitovis]WKD57431.1 Chromosome partition protein Smc [Corynebacterium capitovis DSM 44611]
MHLKSLTLKGFKSFASATTMKFEPGICAVVGPNGSGKSNVVDALAWVMGEQGVKNLRGGKMEDVIFAGAGDRKPLGRAEVTLTFDNSDQHLPIDYTEVAITRRMFRDGASEYEINGSRARLMDVQELLSDSGIGREMHIIVGQGKLSDILESRPEERRAFIEEAAGVLKHRRRKEKAQRKLTGMQGNVDRLQDLTDELAKQLKPLARQAEAAQRAATVQSTVRDARLKLAGDRVVTLRAVRDEAVRASRVAAEEAGHATQALERAHLGQQRLEELQQQAQPEAEEAQRQWLDLSALVERVGATVRIAQERAANTGDRLAYAGPDPDDLAAQAAVADEEFEAATERAEAAAERLETIREEAEELQAKAENAEREHAAQVRAIADRREGVVRLVAQSESQRQATQTAEEDLARLLEVLEETRRRVLNAERDAAEAAARIEGCEDQRAPLIDANAQAHSESTAAERRLDELRSSQREREGAVYALESRIATLEEQAPAPAAELGPGFGSLAGRISAADGVDTALAAALGPHAEALCGVVDAGTVETLRAAHRAVVIDERGGDSWRLDSDAAADWLLDHVTIGEEVRGAVTRLLVDVALAPDVATAQEIVAADPRLRAVTRDGVLIGEGWVAAGAGSPTSVEVTGAVERARRELDTARARLEELTGTLEGARIAADEARVVAAGAKAALREHDASVESYRREHARLAKHVAANKSEHERAAQRVTEAEARLARRRADLEETLDRLARVEDTEAPAEPSTAPRDNAREALTQVRAMEMEATVAYRTAQRDAQAIAGRGDSLRRHAERERQAKARHDAAQEKRMAQAEVARAVEKHARDIVARAQDALERAMQRRDQLAQRSAELSQQLQAARSEVSAARQHAERLTQRAHAADLERSEAQVRVDEAEAKASESLGLPVNDLVEGYTPAPDFDRGAEERRLKQAERDLRALGKVNPLALEEFKALEERYTFLSTQLDDVLRARRDLTQVITDVDRHILQLFTVAWRDVEEMFPAVFRTLFPGGEARLVLTDPSDLLATGIEIEARPPGKKVKRLSLLSGGEKSLTALAFLVAIFRARPSPFYVLDEVEAALDDVNLRRLIALLEELRRDSQLIVITHQKPTMDVANVLYGVTMRGDGVTRVISQRMSPSPA